LAAIAKIWLLQPTSGTFTFLEIEGFTEVLSETRKWMPLKVNPRYSASSEKRDKTQIIWKLFASGTSHKQIFAINYLIKFANIWSSTIF
jgi:hypothetical protein